MLELMTVFKQINKAGIGFSYCFIIPTFAKVDCRLIMKEIFQYGEKEIAYLKKVDPVFGNIIDQIGHIERGVIPDLFASLIRSTEANVHFFYLFIFNFGE